MNVDSALAALREPHPRRTGCCCDSRSDRRRPHLARLARTRYGNPAWYKSIFENVREFIHPQALPPLELTSKPVAVRDIWGTGTSRRALASSMLFQGAIVAALMLVGTNAKVQKAITNVVLMAPPPPPKPVTAKPNQGGGGGSHIPAPASQS